MVSSYGSASVPTLCSFVLNGTLGHCCSCIWKHTDNSCSLDSVGGCLVPLKGSSWLSPSSCFSWQEGMAECSQQEHICFACCVLGGAFLHLSVLLCFDIHSLGFCNKFELDVSTESTPSSKPKPGVNCPFQETLTEYPCITGSCFSCMSAPPHHFPHSLGKCLLKACSVAYITEGSRNSQD